MTKRLTKDELQELEVKDWLESLTQSDTKNRKRIVQRSRAGNWATNPSLGVKKDYESAENRIIELEKQVRIKYEITSKIAKITADMDYVRKHMKVLDDLLYNLYTELKRK